MRHDLGPYLNTVEWKVSVYDAKDHGDFTQDDILSLVSFLIRH